MATSKELFYSSFCIIIIAIISFNLYQNYIQKCDQQKSFNYSPRIEKYSHLFTKDELAKYDGKPGSRGIYIGILGLVFNVERGRKHYEPGSSYEIFAGRDASKSFVTGQFEGVDINELDNVLQLDPADRLSLIKWVNFYTENYDLVGKLIGRFYDENGKETEYNHMFYKHANKLNDPKVLEAKKKESRNYPACNIEWKPNEGTRVWCTQNSGGIKRDWIGYPRQYSTSKSSEETRCICAQQQNLGQDMIKEYPGCDSMNRSCIIPNTKKTDLDEKDKIENKIKEIVDDDDGVVIEAIDSAK